jgi:hypothetical protein
MEIFTKNSAKCTVFQSTICNKFSSLMHINEFDVQSCNGMTLLLHIRSFIPNSFYFMLFSIYRLLCQSSLFHWTNKSGPLLQSCVPAIVSGWVEHIKKQHHRHVSFWHKHSTNMNQKSTMPVSSIISFL